MLMSESLHLPNPGQHEIGLLSCTNHETGSEQSCVIQLVAALESVRARKQTLHNRHFTALRTKDRGF